MSINVRNRQIPFDDDELVIAACRSLGWDISKGEATWGGITIKGQVIRPPDSEFEFVCTPDGRAMWPNLDHNKNFELACKTPVKLVSKQKADFDRLFNMFLTAYIAVQLKRDGHAVQDRRDD